MNSNSRYYLTADDWKSDILILTGDEAHHCTRVLRSNMGDSVEVFDGCGRAVRGEIVELSKDQVCIRPSGEVIISEKSAEIHLCQAIPKGGNMELIVQKAVELGVASIQPLITENTVARAEQLAKKQKKWQRVALEACKQCGQNSLPVVYPAVKFSEFVQQARGAEGAEIKLIAALHESSVDFSEVFPLRADSVSLLVGPEGDFSDSEYDEALALGYRAVSLGSIVLRVETATLYSLSVLRHELGK